jgi:uncharacterized protein (TIGR02996 family)
VTDDFSFLRAIFNRPDDDGLRLIYADWLEERGDPRAEFLRLEAEHHLKGRGKRRPAPLPKRLTDLAPSLDSRWVERMWKTRRLPPGARLDLVVVGDGKGLIEVRGQDETALYVEGRPVALNWNDCQGSVGQYLVFTGHTRGADHARQLAELVEGEVDAARPLGEQIEPLLAVFVPGLYCLTYSPSAAVETSTTLEYPANAVGELVGYYPADDHHLVCTQKLESLNAGRVAYYRERIRAGRRPIVLTASAEDAWCQFVIDGHHKLAAYNREQVRPTILGIVRWQAPAITLAEGLGFLPPGHPGMNEYRRMRGAR